MISLEKDFYWERLKEEALKNNEIQLLINKIELEYAEELFQRKKCMFCENHTYDFAFTASDCDCKIKGNEEIHNEKCWNSEHNCICPFFQLEKRYLDKIYKNYHIKMEE